MIVVCSKCQKRLGRKEPISDPQFIFTLCKACHEELFPKEQAQSLSEYLDRFDTPVAAVDAEGRIIAANETLSRLLEKEDRKAAGLLCGEALECEHAQMNERCGNTIHCKTCTIRNAITKTLETGEPQKGIPAYLNQRDRRLRFLISTRKDTQKNIVILEIEELY